MPIIAENKSQEFILAPAGNHIARCYGMIELGTIKEASGIFAGKEQRKCRISWELPYENHDFGAGPEPFVIHKEFTISMSEKATLRKMLESWRGKPFTDEEAKAFDITKLLTKPCTLNVIHKRSASGKDYADITSIAPLPKGANGKTVECLPQVNGTFELSYSNWNSALFETLPDFIKSKMKSSPEFQAMTAPGPAETPAAPVNVGADDLPF